MHRVGRLKHIYLKLFILLNINNMIVIEIYFICDTSFKKIYILLETPTDLEFYRLSRELLASSWELSSHWLPRNSNTDVDPAEKFHYVITEFPAKSIKYSS